MNFHEVLTRVMSGLLAFPVFLALLVGLGMLFDRAGDAVGINVLNYRISQALFVGFCGVSAIALVWRLLRWVEPQHWQGAGLGVSAIRLFADGAIAAVAASALYSPVKAAYVVWNPSAFTGWLGGLDALKVIPIAAVLCLFMSIVLIVLRRAGVFPARD